ncbi:MAG TPA: Mpo1-like protein [Usitatibacter sp.]|nr:Mpo1-like protein [Usitatibacter sp.]
MSPLERALASYAAYHRDRRNIATHFAGIPMIVLAAVIAAGTLAVPIAGMEVTLAAVLSLAACAWYFRLDPAFGATLAVALLAACAIASEAIARLGTGSALALAALLFVAGWALQFLGHRYEGVKPAFFDDLRQLLVGPLFVCAEAAFLLGGRGELRGAIEARVGPTVPRRDGAPLPLVPR